MSKQPTNMVSVPSTKPNIGISDAVRQPKVGKLGGGMSAMPGSSGKGQMIKTGAKSNLIQGKGKSSGTAMGKGGVIPGFA